MSKDARIWRVYVDEANKADTIMTEGWNRSLDVLLVFVSIPYFTTRRKCLRTIYLDRIVLCSSEYFHSTDLQPAPASRSRRYN